MDIKIYKRRVEEGLESYFNNLEIPTKDDVVKEAIKNLKEFTLRPAKRFRPILMIAAYKCFVDDDEIIMPSLSIELMQSSLLIHDDIMDRDDIRRGKKTMHKLYENKRDPNYGISMGINIGDLCAILMFETLNKSGFNTETKFKAYNKLMEIYKKE
ncbi:MAG TPA: polyprenyl synthetase family protein, partial [Candidatus Lokiarchaeia archaeon]